MEPLRHLDEAVSTRRSRRLPVRCVICRRRVSSLIRIEESGDVPEPHQSWWLCTDCDEAVASQLARSPTTGTLRLRIAVGIVAAERHPAYRSRARAMDDDQRSDQRIERLLIVTIVGLFLLHGLVFIVVALAISPPH
jgi:hypothetical protein